MSPFQALAAQIVAEIPITRLQGLLQATPHEPDTFTVGGGFCGNNCVGNVGSVCGIKCNPPAGAPGVIDRDGELAITVSDLKAIRDDLPQLRQAVLDEFTPHLDRLRANY